MLCDVPRGKQSKQPFSEQPNGQFFPKKHLFTSHGTLILHRTDLENPAAGHKILREICEMALADVTQWIKQGSVKQRIIGSIPSQGTCLGCRPGPR